MSLEEIVNSLEELNEYRETHRLEFYIPYDFQKAFHHAESQTEYPNGRYEVADGTLAVQRALMAGNQCITKETLIETEFGNKSIGSVFGQDIRVYSWSGKKKVLRDVVSWFKKPPEECYRLNMADGQWIECSANHRILTSSGYVSCGQLLASLPILRESSSALSQPAHGEDGRHYSQRPSSYQDDYLKDLHQYDGQPLSEKDSDLTSSPSQDDVRQHTSFQRRHLGGRGNKYIDTLYAWLYRLSNQGVFRRTLGQSFVFLNRVFLRYAQHMTQNALLSQQSSSSQYLFGTPVLLSQYLPRIYASSESPIVKGNQIVSYTPIGVHTIYDMEVEEFHNYYAGGIINHNSGKTLSAAMEVAMHCTGLYPEWWQGQRFSRAVNCVVAGKSNDSVRDVVQNELLGDPFSETAEGTGTLPKELIGKTTRKAGVPNAKSAVMVKHVSGKWSKIRFMAYEQGPDPYMGIKFDVGWLDEEPPQDVWTQFIRGTISRKAGEYQLMLTFTPEEGVTEVVDGFMNNLTVGQALIRAGWDDAAHMTKDRQAELLEQLPPHERDMRSKGIPMMGSGLVFPVNEDDIKIEPFSIPAYWPVIVGIDFGWDHPFAAVWLAWDRDKDIVYITDTYRVSKALPPIHASAIKKRGGWSPIVWPHDGLNTDKGSGIPLASLYRQEGLNLLPNKFSNPPSPNQKEGQGGNGIEVGLFDMLTRMEEGRLKVFSNLFDWMEERRQYHRKDGKIVALREDLMSATRYAIMSLRFASIKPQPKKIVNKSVGLQNW